MHYYEIQFYGEGHVFDWSFYFSSETNMNKDAIKSKLKEEFLGVDGLDMHHIKNIKHIWKITAHEFERLSGLSTKFDTKSFNFSCTYNDGSFEERTIESTNLNSAFQNFIDSNSISSFEFGDSITVKIV